MADTTAGKALVEGSLAGAFATFAIAVAPALPEPWQLVFGPAVGLAIAVVKAARNEYAKTRAHRKRRRAGDAPVSLDKPLSKE